MGASGRRRGWRLSFPARSCTYISGRRRIARARGRWPRGPAALGPRRSAAVVVVRGSPCTSSRCLEHPRSRCRRSLCFCRGLTNSPVSSFAPGHAAGLVADRGRAPLSLVRNQPDPRGRNPRERRSQHHERWLVSHFSETRSHTQLSPSASVATRPRQWEAAVRGRSAWLV